MHIEAVGRDADLAGIAELEQRAQRCRLVDIGILADHDGRMAAELHRAALDGPGGLGEQHLADPRRAGERDLAHLLGGHQERRDRFGRAEQHLDGAGRRAAFGAGLRDQGRGQRRLFGWAADDRAAGGERRRDLAGEQVDREIPRGEGGDDADRLQRRGQAPALARGDRLAEQALGLAGEPVELLDGDQHFALGLGDRPADLIGQRVRQRALARLHRPGDAAQDLGALPAMHARPCPERGARMMERLLDLGRAGARRRPELFLRAGIADRKRRQRSGRPELAADEKLGRKMGHR